MRQRAAQALGQIATPTMRQLLGESMKGAPYEVQVTTASILAKSIEGKTELLKRIRQGYTPARVLKDRTSKNFSWQIARRSKSKSSKNSRHR
jgi:hypothetical protein